MFFRTHFGPHYSLFVENADINDSCICTCNLCNYPSQSWESGNIATVATSCVCRAACLSWYCARHAARAAHKTIAHTKTISGGYLSRQRGDGGWNTKITFEHRHFAVEMWKSKCLSDSVTTSPLNWEVDSELFGSVGGETFLEYQARNFFLNRIILRSSYQLLTWLSRPDCCKNTAKKLDVYTTVYCLLPTQIDKGTQRNDGEVERGRHDHCWPELQ